MSDAGGFKDEKIRSQYHAQCIGKPVFPVKVATTKTARPTIRNYFVEIEFFDRKKSFKVCPFSD